VARQSTISLTPPADYLLSRDVCSYGYFLLRPNFWDIKDQVFWRTLHLDGGATTARIAQAEPKAGPRAGAKLSARFDRTLRAEEKKQARAQLVRMLRLDEPHDVVREFHKLDPRWKVSGRARLFRSPTLFEDIIKTVTSCNVTWTSTINMNRRMCEAFGTRSASGGQAFPTPEKLARTRPGTLRGRCSVGYRDQRIVDLAKLYTKGEIDPAWLESPGVDDDDAFKFLLGLPGIGPYAAGNIMQLLGRFSRLALDTESIRHAKSVLNMKGTDAQLMKRLTRYYDRFGAHRFRSYWFELWDFYESKRGKAWTWDRDTTGTTFTASQLEDKPRKKAAKKTAKKAAKKTSKKKVARKAGGR